MYDIIRSRRNVDDHWPWWMQTEFPKYSGLAAGRRVVDSLLAAFVDGHYNGTVPEAERVA